MSEKTFIVAPGFVGYTETIERLKLDPGLCFQCESAAEAQHGVDRNTMQGIPARWIPAVTAKANAA